MTLDSAHSTTPILLDDYTGPMPTGETPQNPAEDPQESGLSIWLDVEPEPTTLIAFWPHNDPPTQMEVLLAMRSYLSQHHLARQAADRHEPIGDIEVLDELETDDENVRWNVLIQTPLPSLDHEIIVWCEPARPVAAGELNCEQAEQSRWVVCFETMLDDQDPLTSYLELMRLASESVGDAPAVLDVNTSMCHDRNGIEQLFGTPDVEPPAEVLWVVHVVSLDEPGDAADAPADPDDALNETMWIHTHGLRRCGRPELEMLAVNNALVNPAAELLNGIAELSLAFELPPPGEPFEVGQNLVVTFQPWQIAAAHLPDSVPGSAQDRRELAEELAGEEEEDLDAHRGLSAVACAPQPVGPRGDKWVYPQQALVQLAQDETVIYRTPRATRRQQVLAQREWPQFATALATVRGSHLNGTHDAPRFLLKAGFDFEDQSSEMTREHLWFDVHNIEKDVAQTSLLNEPHYVTSFARGDEVRVDRSLVSDWIISTPLGDFGPVNINEMWNAIDAMKNAADTTDGQAEP